ncbi:unnamed protein product [Hapterophycus canaliculatus]
MRQSHEASVRSRCVMLHLAISGYGSCLQFSLHVRAKPPPRGNGIVKRAVVIAPATIRLRITTRWLHVAPDTNRQTGLLAVRLENKIPLVFATEQ